MKREERTAESWRKSRQVEDLDAHRGPVLAILEEVRAAGAVSDRTLRAILKRHPRDGSRFYSKNLLIRVYLHLCEDGTLERDDDLLRRIQMKPIRTLSGVAPVTVLTRPEPCPGDCIFCPTESCMPKSYLSGEPGAQRAKQHGFDPQAQTRARLEALRTNGHPVDKVELLVLGGSWTAYPREYQDWFLLRCLEALNGEPAGDLEEAQRINEGAPHRNVGLVVETRPDQIDQEAVALLRRQGVTKVQLGAQSLDDALLQVNRRGHTVDDTRRAVGLLRRAAFKIVLHWMPNLLGADPDRDRADFQRLWSDPALRPDEIKIYPCSLLEGTGLYDAWQQGLYRPYSDHDLIELIADCKARVPSYCRINRVYRDIPTTYVVEGCRISNLRELVQKRLRETGRSCRCLRCREVRGAVVQAEALQLTITPFETTAGQERFLCLEDDSAQAAGYLRLLLPGRAGPDPGIPELAGAALVREVHVYGPAQSLGKESSGPAQSLGKESSGPAQHQGLGTMLLASAEDLARQAGFRRMAIIAAVGTRRYYAARGYRLDGTYMVRELV